ncbi:hypothetical protein [Neisseria animaloris]|uniref:hypothetical protein n=1 Tax=Neisseria animaloris TaxID=326522 RepID=UPI00131EB429|nr:hypothetical protein [Neisseria animaloris]
MNEKIDELLRTKISINEYSGKDETEITKAAYEKRVVVFLDILGFKDAIRKSINNPEELETLIYSLELPKDPSAHTFITTWKTGKKPDEYDDRLTTFSDFFAFSVPLKLSSYQLGAEGAENLTLLIYTVFNRARELLFNGFLCRGGIASGDLYHNDSEKTKILFGPAFNRAYQLESELANTPRIILDSYVKKLIDNYKNLPANKDCPFKKLFDAHIKQAIDGPAYIDIFADFYTNSESAYKEYANLDEHIAKIRQHLCNKLQDATDSPHIFHKVASISRLFNTALKESGRSCNKELLIPTEHLPE